MPDAKYRPARQYQSAGGQCQERQRTPYRRRLRNSHADAHRHGRNLHDALGGTPALAAEITRLSAELDRTRLDRANLRAAIRATLAAHADGEPDPMWYLRDALDAPEMAARGRRLSTFTQMRGQARQARRSGLQPMMVINSGEPFPETVGVVLLRAAWRYRSELAVAVTGGLVAAAWWLHAAALVVPRCRAGRRGRLGGGPVRRTVAIADADRAHLRSGHHFTQQACGFPPQSRSARSPFAPSAIGVDCRGGRGRGAATRARHCSRQRASATWRISRDTPDADRHYR